MINPPSTLMVWREEWRLASFNATPHLEREGEPGLLTSL